MQQMDADFPELHECLESLWPRLERLIDEQLIQCFQIRLASRQFNDFTERATQANIEADKVQVNRQKLHKLSLLKASLMHQLRDYIQSYLLATTASPEKTLNHSAPSIMKNNSTSTSANSADATTTTTTSASSLTCDNQVAELRLLDWLESRDWKVGRAFEQVVLETIRCEPADDAFCSLLPPELYEKLGAQLRLGLLDLMSEALEFKLNLQAAAIAKSFQENHYQDEGHSNGLDDFIVDNFTSDNNNNNDDDDREEEEQEEEEEFYTELNFGFFEQVGRDASTFSRAEYADSVNLNVEPNLDGADEQLAELMSSEMLTLDLELDLQSGGRNSIIRARTMHKDGCDAKAPWQGVEFAPGQRGSGEAQRDEEADCARSNYLGSWGPSASFGIPNCSEPTNLNYSAFLQGPDSNSDDVEDNNEDCEHSWQFPQHGGRWTADNGICDKIITLQNHCLPIRTTTSTNEQRTNNNVCNNQQQHQHQVGHEFEWQELETNGRHNLWLGIGAPQVAMYPQHEHGQSYESDEGAKTCSQNYHFKWAHSQPPSNKSRHKRLRDVPATASECCGPAPPPLVTCNGRQPRQTQIKFRLEPEERPAAEPSGHSRGRPKGTQHPATSQRENEQIFDEEHEDQEEQEGEEDDSNQDVHLLAGIASEVCNHMPMEVAEQMEQQASLFVRNRKQQQHQQQQNDKTASARRLSRKGGAWQDDESQTASGSSEDHEQVKIRRTRRVRVKKCKPILGIAIEGGFEVSGQLLPRILFVHEEGAAYRCGKIRAGDLILEVNGTSTVDMTHKQIAETIANSYYQDQRPYIEFIIGESTVIQ